MRRELVGRRLKLVSVVAPLVFFLALELAHVGLAGAPWWTPALEAWWRVAAVVVVCVGIAAFSWLMLDHIGRAEDAIAHDFAELYRRRDEGHAIYSILLGISRQSGTLPTLTELAGHARDLLDADAAAVVIDVATANTVRFDSAGEAPLACADGSTLLGVGLPSPAGDGAGGRVNPITASVWAASAEDWVLGSAGAFGTLWVGRREGRPFTDRDRSFLRTLAGLAGIALTSAQVREQARQREVLDERTRIAREMHDSLAQVLGAMHLRLRMLQGLPAVAGDEDAASEVAALADTADAGYRDVREVILGLRGSDRADIGLEEALRAHVAAFAEQSGVPTEFSNDTGGPIALSPRAEVHLVRVVQEALTNVRKHARATHARVTVTGGDDSTTITIADDGCGFLVPADAPAGAGYGLFTMRDRLSLLRGSLRLESLPGRGTRVVATVPERASSAAGRM